MSILPLLPLWKNSPVCFSYGKHLSKEDVDTLVAPHSDTVEAVESWLSYHGVNAAEQSRSSWINVPMTIAQAEKMLGATYGVYFHEESESYTVRTLGYSLPKELHSHIKVITPTTYFSSMKSMRTTSFVQEQVEEDERTTALTDAAVTSSCATAITLSCLQALYNSEWGCVQ